MHMGSVNDKKPLKELTLSSLWELRYVVWSGLLGRRRGLGECCWNLIRDGWINVHRISKGQKKKKLWRAATKFCGNRGML